MWQQHKKPTCTIIKVSLLFENGFRILCIQSFACYKENTVKTTRQKKTHTYEVHACKVRQQQQQRKGKKLRERKKMCNCELWIVNCKRTNCSGTLFVHAMNADSFQRHAWNWQRFKKKKNTFQSTNDQILTYSHPCLLRLHIQSVHFFLCLKHNTQRKQHAKLFS